MREIREGQTVYLARISPKTDICEVCELYVRTVYKDIFIGVDQATGRLFIVKYDDCDNFVFDNREDALKIVKEAKKDKQGE